MPLRPSGLLGSKGRFGSASTTAFSASAFFAEMRSSLARSFLMRSRFARSASTMRWPSVRRSTKALAWCWRLLMWRFSRELNRFCMGGLVRVAVMPWSRMETSPLVDAFPTAAFFRDVWSLRLVAAEGPRTVAELLFFLLRFFFTVRGGASPASQGRGARPKRAAASYARAPTPALLAASLKSSSMSSSSLASSSLSSSSSPSATSSRSSNSSSSNSSSSSSKSSSSASAPSASNAS